MLKGVHYRIISSSDSLQKRIEVSAKIIKDLNLSDEEIEILKRNGVIKVLDLPFQVFISDGKVAFLLIHTGQPEPLIFISDDIEFIKWSEKLFDYFWELAEPIDFPSALDEALKKIGDNSE